MLFPDGRNRLLLASASNSFTLIAAREMPDMARARKTDAQPAKVEGPQAAVEPWRSQLRRELLQDFVRFGVKAFILWIVMAGVLSRASNVRRQCCLFGQASHETGHRQHGGDATGGPRWRELLNPCRELPLGGALTGRRR